MFYKQNRLRAVLFFICCHIAQRFWRINPIRAGNISVKSLSRINHGALFVRKIIYYENS